MCIKCAGHIYMHIYVSCIYYNLCIRSGSKVMERVKAEGGSSGRISPATEAAGAENKSQQPTSPEQQQQQTDSPHHQDSAEERHVINCCCTVLLFSKRERFPIFIFGQKDNCLDRFFFLLSSFPTCECWRNILIQLCLEFLVLYHHQIFQRTQCFGNHVCFHPQHKGYIPESCRKYQIVYKGLVLMQNNRWGELNSVTHVYESLLKIKEV
jgi:hypothetical protein